MKILIVGCNGQLGNELKSILQKGSSEIGSIPDAYIGAEVACEGRDTIDISKSCDVYNNFDKFKPNVVFNCAAYTNVDGCETNFDTAFTVNAIGARNLSMACEAHNAKLVHVSTDYVFDGNADVPYKECDLPQPVSAYGKTKLAGEQFIHSFCRRYFIVRTAWLYGHIGNNFVKTILRYAKEKGELRVVNDQYGNPTNANDLAHHLLKIALTDEYGVYHCTGEGLCSWYDLAAKIVEYANINAKINPVTTLEYNSHAKRPAFSGLDNMMLRCTVGNEMREWQQALACFLKNY